jgi:hypothetical protein
MAKILITGCIVAAVSGVGMVATAPPPKLTPATKLTIDQSGSDPAFGSFLGACNQDSDCGAGNTCGSFKKRGSHCTHTCVSDADCSGGVSARCTKQGRCGLNEPLKTEQD